MSEISKFTSAQKLLSKLKECDIVEFNRVVYSHYGLYIGNGICVHVEGPAGQSFSSSSSSSSSSGNCKKGTKSAQLLTVIAGQSPCRIREYYLIAVAAEERPKSEAKALALRGLPTDDKGAMILGATIEVDYAVVSNNNCEGWATYWKFTNSFTLQVGNGIVGSSVGTMERIYEHAVYDLEKIVEDRNVGTVKRLGAASGVVLAKPVALTMTTIRKTTDIASAGLGWVIQKLS